MLYYQRTRLSIRASIFINVACYDVNKSWSGIFHSNVNVFMLAFRLAKQLFFKCSELLNLNLEPKYYFDRGQNYGAHFHKTKY